MGFDAIKETGKIIEFIRDYYKKNNLKGAVLGISGGKDSGVVAALLCSALGSENVIGLTLPCHSLNEDRSLAQKVADFYKFKLYNLDLTPVYDEFIKNMPSEFKNLDDKHYLNSNINLKPRLRMASVYYFAAMLSGMHQKPYLTVGTSNKSEIYVGYFTKGGDSVHDIAPIADLTVSEVIKVGQVLGVPHEILYRTPSDGLSGKSDEDKLGVTYKEIEEYLQDKSKVTAESAAIIERHHKNNLHKFEIPTYRKSK